MDSANANQWGEICLEHLEAAVRVDTQSDETSETIPSTEGQRKLAETLTGKFESLGFRVELDAQANLLASLPGRGAASNHAPLAFMVHLDTSRGTEALPKLTLHENWDGSALPYAANPDIRVDTTIYPSVTPFVGQTIVYGPGDRPFGLDDKLGLAQMLTLAGIVSEGSFDHPPLLMIARPDEEIGRMEAVESLSGELAKRGVRYGFTLDGLLPFEINVENFNASHVSALFPTRAGLAAADARCVRIRGVNTHGATAKAEGYRAAVRLAAEWVHEAPGLVVESIESDQRRDCDAVVRFQPAGNWSEALDRVMTPHVPRGGGWDDLGPVESDVAAGHAAMDVLTFVSEFLSSEPGFVLAAEDSDGREGYSAPYRARMEDQGVRLDVRLRDFDPDGLRARERHIVAVLSRHGITQPSLEQQYVNMGPQLESHAQLIEWPTKAARRAGVSAPVAPIRGGTGVDPFLDKNVLIGNLGTGYFAPESEKEFTSVEMMGRHVAWLVELLKVASST